jgi:hypothetical protein
MAAGAWKKNCNRLGVVCDPYTFKTAFTAIIPGKGKFCHMVFTLIWNNIMPYASSGLMWTR